MNQQEIEQLQESDQNGQHWFNAYGEIDQFLFTELENIGIGFPIVSDRPELNTIEAIKLLMKNNQR